MIVIFVIFFSFAILDGLVSTGEINFQQITRFNPHYSRDKELLLYNILFYLLCSFPISKCMWLAYSWKLNVHNHRATQFFDQNRSLFIKTPSFRSPCLCNKPFCCCVGFQVSNGVFSLQERFAGNRISMIITCVLIFLHHAFVGYLLFVLLLQFLNSRTSLMNTWTLNLLSNVAKCGT